MPDHPREVYAGTSRASGRVADAQTSAGGGISFYLRLQQMLSGGQARCPGLSPRDFGHFGVAARTATKSVFDTLNAGNG